MRPKPSYEALGREEPGVGHPIDLAVHARIGRDGLHRKVANAAQAVVDALGRKRRLWFVYEDALARLTDLRQAAYFDLGVEHGVAAARAERLTGASKAIERLAAKLVREALARNVARQDATAAAVMAAWALARETRRARPG